jgi:hypothetical protein
MNLIGGIGSINSLIGSLIVSGGAGISGNLNVGGNIIVCSIPTNGQIFNVFIGDISYPSSKYSMGSLSIRSINGTGNYRTWNVNVGTSVSGTTGFDTER